MQAGDQVLIKRGLEPYFKAGDKAVLRSKEGGGWWADIVNGQTERYIGKPGDDFDPLTVS